MTETHLRSVVKGISWRILATIDTIVLAYIFTGSIKTALSIGGLELITKTFLYYAHERVWQHVRFGKHDSPDRPYRSLSKAISWRFFGTLDTFLISLFITQKLVASLSIGLTELITKVALFYIHERVWLRISWGCKR